MAFVNTDELDVDELFRLIAAGEPEELRMQYLAVPGSGPQQIGSTVPLLGLAFGSRPSGLLVPEQHTGARIGAYAKRYMTAAEILPVPMTSSATFTIIRRHPTEDVLAACAQLMATLYDPHPASPDTQRGLIGQFCVGETKDLALALLGDDWLFMSPQLVLAVAKVALLFGPSGEPNDGRTAFSDVVAGALGLAQFLGAHREDDDGPRWWGTLPESVALELVQNQHFFKLTNVGSLLGRHQRLRELAAERYPAESARADAIFEEATGFSPQVAFDVTFTMHALLRQDKTVRVARPLFDTLVHPASQVDAVLDWLAPPIERLVEEVNAEAARTGFDWGFNVFRRFPVLRADSGEYVCLNMNYLLAHACGVGVFWETRAALNDKVRTTRGPDRKAARTVQGEFEHLGGHVPEAYVGDSLTPMAETGPGMVQRLWTEKDLQAIWPGESCCDFLIDGGTAWIAVEVVSHALTEKSASGGALAALEDDLNLIVYEKAEQLQATIGRLIANGSALPGDPARPAVRYHPVIVATSGFPWNALTAAAVHGRLAELDRLQHPLVDPVTVIDLNDLEEVEAAVVAGRIGLTELFDRRLASGAVSTPMDTYLHLEGIGLKCPERLVEPMHQAFVAISAANGLERPSFPVRDDGDGD